MEPNYFALRGALAPNDPRQAALAPQEHAQFAREWTQQNPYMAVPSLLAGIPLYQLAKLMKLHPSRTPPSMDQMAGAYQGMWQGLTK